MRWVLHKLIAQPLMGIAILFQCPEIVMWLEDTAPEQRPYPVFPWWVPSLAWVILVAGLLYALS